MKELEMLLDEYFYATIAYCAGSVPNGKGRCEEARAKINKLFLKEIGKKYSQEAYESVDHSIIRDVGV